MSSSSLSSPLRYAPLKSKVSMSQSCEPRTSQIYTRCSTTELPALGLLRWIVLHLLIWVPPLGDHSGTLFGPGHVTDYKFQQIILLFCVQNTLPLSQDMKQRQIISNS